MKVEWVYELVTSVWKQLNYKYNIKLSKSSNALIYSVGVLLTNMHTCMYGNQVITRFLATHPSDAPKPPSLQPYFHG